MQGESPFADPHTVPAILCAAGTMLLVRGYAEMSQKLRDAVVSHARPSRVMSALRSLTMSDSTQLPQRLTSCHPYNAHRPLGRSFALTPITTTKKECRWTSC